MICLPNRIQADGMDFITVAFPNINGPNNGSHLDECIFVSPSNHTLLPLGTSIGMANFTP